MHASDKTETVLTTGSCRLPKDHSGIEDRERCVLQQSVLVVEHGSVERIDGACGEMLWTIVHAGHVFHFLSSVPVEGGKSDFFSGIENPAARRSDRCSKAIEAHPVADGDKAKSIVRGLGEFFIIVVPCGAVVGDLSVRCV